MRKEAQSMGEEGVELALLGASRGDVGEGTALLDGEAEGSVVYNDKDKSA